MAAELGNLAGVRKSYRDLKREVEVNRSEYASAGSTRLSSVIDTANNLWQSGAKSDARAGALDADLLNYTSGIGAEQAGNLEKRTPSLFVHSLLAKCVHIRFPSCTL